MLFSSIFRIELSLIDHLRMRSGCGCGRCKGESSSKLSRSSRSAGNRRLCRASGSGASVDGSNSWIKPLGSGLVELTRMNCARCSATSSVMKALTKIGKRVDAGVADRRCALLAVDDPAGPLVLVERNDERSLQLKRRDRVGVVRLEP